MQSSSFDANLSMFLTNDFDTICFIGTKQLVTLIEKVGRCHMTLRLFPIMLVKLAYYAPSNAGFFPKLCSNYAHFSKLCPFGLKKCWHDFI